MFIVFDLDDTLIETTKCLGPIVMEQVYSALSLQGLQTDQAPFEELLNFNANALSSSIAIENFCDAFDLDSALKNLAHIQLNTPLLPDVRIDPVKGAKKLLSDLAKDHYLGLVTLGQETRQLEKMEKAGIERSLFGKLIVVGDGTKKEIYEDLLREWGLPPSGVVVVGDRIPIDLSPAKALGLFTVHFRNGRGQNHSSPKEDVDVSIDHLDQLREVLAKYEVKGAVNK